MDIINEGWNRLLSKAQERTINLLESRKQKNAELREMDNRFQDLEETHKELQCKLSDLGERYQNEFKKLEEKHKKTLRKYIDLEETHEETQCKLKEMEELAEDRLETLLENDEEIERLRVMFDREQQRNREILKEKEDQQAKLKELERNMQDMEMKHKETQCKLQESEEKNERLPVKLNQVLEKKEQQEEMQREMQCSIKEVEVADDDRLGTLLESRRSLQVMLDQALQRKREILDLLAKVSQLERWNCWKYHYLKQCKLIEHEKENESLHARLHQAKRRRDEAFFQDFKRRNMELRDFYDVVMAAEKVELEKRIKEMKEKKYTTC